MPNAAVSASINVWSWPTDYIAQATVDIARHVASRTHVGKLTSVAGGGDTVAALNAAGVTDDEGDVSDAEGADLKDEEGASRSWSERERFLRKPFDLDTLDLSFRLAQRLPLQPFAHALPPPL